MQPGSKRPIGIYIAASRECAGQADEIAAKLRGAGFQVKSRWHDGQTKLVDPASADDRRRVLLANLADLEASDIVVALMRDGAPKATYGEIAWALCYGRFVYWLGPGEGEADSLACIFDAHPYACRVASEDALMAELGSLQETSVAIDRDGVFCGPGWQACQILKHSVTKREEEILAALGGDFSQDSAAVGVMMAEATKSMCEAAALLVSPKQAGNEPRSMSRWMECAVHLLAYAMIGGKAALSAEALVSVNKPEMN